jgi:CHAD domain-containing protein
MKNEILEEVWEARKKLEASENGDLDILFQKTKEKSEKSNRKKYRGENSLKKTRKTSNH